MDEAEKKKLASDKLKATVGGVESDKSSNLDTMEDQYLREGLFVLHDLILSKLG
jgi:carboxyl-terminal processing protease